MVTGKNKMYALRLSPHNEEYLDYVAESPEALVVVAKEWVNELFFPEHAEVSIGEDTIEVEWWSSEKDIEDEPDGRENFYITKMTVVR